MINLTSLTNYKSFQSKTHDLVITNDLVIMAHALHITCYGNIKQEFFLYIKGFTLFTSVNDRYQKNI